MTKHTPGEWVSFRNANGELALWDQAGNNLLASESKLPLEQRLANARLMAASPSMLNLLESIEEAYGEIHDGDQPVSGADLVEWFFTTLMPEVRKELERAKGKST